MATKDFNVSLPLAAGAMALAIMLAACSSGDGNSRTELRKLAGVTEAQATSLPSPTLPPSPTETPDFIPPVPTSQPVIVEVTRESVSVQQIEVTRIVEVVITATPDIQGFSEPAIDESAQPCPIRYWKRGRCTATQAQIEAASEVKP